MRRLARIFVGAVLGVAAALPIQMTAPSAAQAALPSCNSYTDFQLGNQKFQSIPTVGRNTGNTNCILGVGNQGDAVRRLQEALAWCNGQGIRIDGAYGSQTRQAVRNVQTGRVTVDGVYGPNTMAVITWPIHHHDGRVTCTL